MNPFHSPIVDTAGAEGTTVTASVVQNAPGISEIVAILPSGLRDVPISIGVLLVETVGDKADPVSVSIGWHRRLSLRYIELRYVSPIEKDSLRGRLKKLRFPHCKLLPNRHYDRDCW